MTKAILTERIDTESYMLPEEFADEEYVDVFNLHPLYEKMAFDPNSNVVLAGPKGIGKSVSVAAFAAKKGYPIVTFSCSEDAAKRDLYGQLTLRPGGNAPFVMGPITTAFDIANEVGHCVLVFEEINALSPACQKLLNPLCDFHRRIEVSAARRVFELENDAKLWVVGTMNASTYGGVYSLNEDLRSRLNIFPLGYPSLEDEKNILTTTMRDATKDVGQKTVNAVLRLAMETRKNEFEYALSTRDIVQILTNIRNVGLKPAMWIASGKFQDNDLNLFQARVKSAFKISL